MSLWRMRPEGHFESEGAIEDYQSTRRHVDRVTCNHRANCCLLEKLPCGRAASFIIEGRWR
jgi:hypothetical protein